MPTILYVPASPTPAIIQYPEEVNAPTPPTIDQNCNKTLSKRDEKKEKHIYSMPKREDFFSPLSQRMSVMPVAWQQAFGTSCFQAINCLGSVLLYF